MPLKLLTLAVFNLFVLIAPTVAQTNFLAETNTGEFGEEELAYNRKLEAEREQLANIRFCNMVDSTNTIDVVSAKEGQNIFKKMTSYKVGVYKTSKPGAQNFLIYETNDRSKPICDPVSFSATAGSSHTVIVYKENNSIKTMVVDDDYKPKNEALGRFRLFNFINGVEVEISDSNGTKQPNISENDIKSLENLNAQATIVEVLATLPDKSIRKWSFNTNFEDKKSLSAFLILDSYGRLRPKVTFDGWRQ
jgi:hypothetical protein